MAILFCRMQQSTREGSGSRQSNTHLFSNVAVTSAKFINYFYYGRCFIFCSALNLFLSLWLMAATTCRHECFSHLWLPPDQEEVLIYKKKCESNQWILVGDTCLMFAATFLYEWIITIMSYMTAFSGTCIPFVGIFTSPVEIIHSPLFVHRCVTWQLYYCAMAAWIDTETFAS